MSKKPRKRPYRMPIDFKILHNHVRIPKQVGFETDYVHIGIDMYQNHIIDSFSRNVRIQQESIFKDGLKRKGFDVPEHEFIDFIKAHCRIEQNENTKIYYVKEIPFLMIKEFNEKIITTQTEYSTIMTCDFGEYKFL